ncbi:PAS domain-containing serine/threonine-protein kinase-like isoform X2 [Mizuhopecten yessoensis]|uniref:PAS domain-containing serine/threonine-protein kinase-like isoform X2 n=1 Tax=Mizuhopecten yessoensis TaxID=6573 RepID=UPI000B45DB25|nr:PAS domain-containing serine/threonine-protein kinase-like isoform X2 [Mizuhopecten yessoensis]
MRFGNCDFSPIVACGRYGRRSLPTETGDHTEISFPRLESSTPNILPAKKFSSLTNHHIHGHHNINTKLGLGRPSAFGSPSFPSPLDRIRPGWRDRARQLGINNEREASFEVNQSFPKSAKSRLCLDDTLAQPKSRPMKYFTNILSDVSFSPGSANKGSFSADPMNVSNTSDNWTFYNSVSNGHTGVIYPSTVRNPNKAICTINAKTSEILVANEIACELFGYEREDFIGRQLKDMIKLKPKDQATIMETHLDEVTGEVVSLSGKVVDAVDSNGIVLPISLWVRKLGQEPRCLVVMEPVHRTVGMVTFNSEGAILSCDDQLAYLHGYMSAEDVEGLDVRDLIPSFTLPCPGKPLSKGVRKQQATGRTKEGSSFPLSVFVKLSAEVERDNEIVSRSHHEDDGVYLGIVWVFSGISGLITFLPSGKIHTINDNFALLLFGYSKAQLVGKDITELIPNFGDIMTEENSLLIPNHSDITTGGDNSCSPRELNFDKPHDSSDDQGIGSSIGSSQTQGTKLDIRLDALSTLQPGVTSTPNKPSPTNPLADDTYFRRAMEKENLMRKCSPLQGGQTLASLVTKLDLTGDSDEEDISVVNSLAPAHPSNTSTGTEGTDSMEAIHDTNEAAHNAWEVTNNTREVTHNTREVFNNTREVTHNTRQLERELDSTMPTDHLMSNRRDAGQQITRLPRDIFDIGRQDMIFRNESNYSEEYDSMSSSGDSVELSSTAELLSARVGALALDVSGQDHSGVSSGDSVVSDQLNRSSPGNAADISNNVCQSYSANYDNNDSVNKSANQSENDNDCGSKNGCDPDYIPKCSPVVIEDSTSSECSPETERPLARDLLSPLPRFPVLDSSRGTGYTPDLLPEDSSSFRHYNEYSSLNLTDSNLSNDTFSTSDDSEDSGDEEEEEEENDTSPLKRFPGNWRPEAAPCDMLNVPEGSYAGVCEHHDGSNLGIIFQVKRVQMEGGQFVYCLWVSRDPEDHPDTSHSYTNLTLASSFNSTMDRSVGECLTDSRLEEREEEEDEESDQQEDEEGEGMEYNLSSGQGLYDIKYETLSSIGKGAFGFVKLACCRTNNTHAVVKFIKKKKVLNECWTVDRKWGRIPLEVSLLTKLDHPNIVKVVDVFENENFIQMVMEKHGSGMDLFEFIDRSPLMDESLASYIFRQMVSAVAYLHCHQILHRDIKDENIILDEHFGIKLIDFGAAAYLSKDKLFGTFCGTLEYCSPEVLMGNKYRGPELEMWSLGVTLYTLVFGENPFFDVDETIQCILKPPFSVSNSLMYLLMWLLHPEPLKRARISDLENDKWSHQPMDISQYKWCEVLPNSEFHGNTAADNRIDSPDSKADQQRWSRTNGVSSGH